MNREELQQKLENLLIGTSAYDMWKVCHKVEDELGKWFDNSQGYYTMRLSGYALTIFYKGWRLVDFTIKRVAHQNYKWFDVVKSVVIDDENFTTTEAEEQKIKHKMRQDNKQYDHSWHFELGKICLRDLTDCLELLQREYPNATAKDIRHLLHVLDSEFWHIEEETLRHRGQ